MIRFAIEKVRDCFYEVEALGLMHWLETEKFRHYQPYKPDIERFACYEDDGMFVVYTARDGEELVGNLTMYLALSMHSQQLIATEDSLFLHPDYRKGRNAMRLINFMVEDMRRRGVVEIMVTAKNDRVGALLQHLAFKPVARQYSLAVAPTALVSQPPVGVSLDDATSRPSESRTAAA